MPLVILVIGTSCTGTPAHTSFQSDRVTSPCNLLTPLVCRLRRNAQRGQRFDAADPEDDFLTHPHFEVATIKLGGDPPVLGTVFSNIGIEKINAYAANAEFPKLGENFSFQNWHRNEQVRVTAADFANREVIKALIQIDRFLNAFLVDLLPEITMAVKQADPDEV